MHSDNFYMCLPSVTKHSSRENKTSHYYVEIPGNLKLDGRWEVGLAEINIPVSWYNIPNIRGNTRLVSIVRQEFLKEGQQYDALGNNRYSEEIPYGNYTSLQSLIETVNNILKKIDNHTFEGNQQNIVIARAPFITMEEQNLKPCLNVGRGDSVILPKEIAEMLRLDNIEDVERRYFDNRVVYKGQRLKYVDDYKKLLSPNREYKKYEARAIPSFSFNTSNLYIYTNIIGNELVGDTYAPLLRSIPCGLKFGESMNNVFISPYYKKIEKTNISEIEILILDQTGKPVQFEYGAVVLVLHFRKV